MSCLKLPRWLNGSAFGSHAGHRVWIPGRERPTCKSFEQVVTAILPNARYVSQVLEYVHYKVLARITVAVAC